MDIGRVIEVLSDNKIIVAIESKGDCDSCQNKFGCNVFSKEDNIMEIITEKKFNAGDMVKVEFLPKYRIIISIFIFLIPIIILLLFYQFSMILFKNELVSVLIGIAGFIFYFGIITLINKFQTKSKYLSPTVIKIDEKSD